MKKLLSLTIAVILIWMMTISLAACGSPDEGSTLEQEQASVQGEEMQGYAGDDGASLDSVDEENYADVAKELFGMDLAAQEGWNLQEAVSYNGVNNLSVAFSVPADADGKAITAEYFDQCLAVTEDGIYAQHVDIDAMAVSKGAAYTSFESFFAGEGTQIENFCSSMWLYDYGGKSIQCAVSVDTGMVELTLTLLS